MRVQDVIDITEYEHLPQAGVQGFFGTFKARLNPQHNSGTRGSLAYIRHRDVSRQDLVVLNVQTFGRANELRVTLASLHDLQRALPDMYTIPQQAPPTHMPQSRGQNQASHPRTSHQAKIQMLSQVAR